MATMLIAYDLRKPGQDYDQLYEVIKGLGGAWWHHLDSTWLLKTSKSAVEVRNAIAAVIDVNDELLVINVTSRARAWRGFNDRGGAWLKHTFE